MPSAAPDAAPRAAERPPLTERRPRILVVDDEPRNLFALRTVLEDLDAEVVATETGEDALRWVLDSEFAVILLDVHMPGMDGYETAELVRSRHKSRHIPIIFLTAVHKDEVHMFRGYSAGAVDYVFKPVEPMILRSKIKVFLELFRNAERIRLQGELERRLLAENIHVRSEKIEAEQALHRSEALRSLIIRSLPVALYTMDRANGQVHRRFVDDKIEQLTGFPASRFDTDPEFWASRIDPAERERVLAEVAAMFERGFMSSEYRWQCADGTYCHIFDQAALVREGRVGPAEVFGTWLDVTDRRRMEQQLAHTQKLEAVRQLTGGIAHDFNNMLTVVIGSLDRLCRVRGLDENAVMWSDMARQGALRCADLTKRLLAFARRQPLEPRRIDINELVREASDLLRLPLADGIDVEIACGDSLWPAVADPSQLESALLNLAINARDAMPEGGLLRIVTANVTLDGAALPRNGGQPGDYVALSVADTGVGMSSEVLDRVFDPFFTTKEVGEGTGLGLSMIYGFVKQSGGHITIDSEVGRGTTVTLYLPRDKGTGVIAHAPKAAAGETERPAGRGELVLVVEDDAEVRHLAAAVLQDLGYRVVEAANGPDALIVLRRQRVDLLFTDWAMPGGMNGREVAAEAVKLHAGLPVLYASAYADRVLAEGKGISSANLLRKPYREHELAAAVGQTLEHAAPVEIAPAEAVKPKKRNRG